MRTAADLRHYFRSLDCVYFAGECEARGVTIGWRTYRGASFVFGRYHVDQKRIGVNRVLARPEVPQHVVLATIYHEMLHAVLGAEHEDHGLTFQLSEQRFAHHVAATVWEHEHCDWLTDQAAAVRP